MCKRGIGSNWAGRYGPSDKFAMGGKAAGRCGERGLFVKWEWSHRRRTSTNERWQLQDGVSETRVAFPVLFDTL